MKKDTKTADTMIEKPYRMRVGMFLFKVRPLNMSQVIEIGELASYMKEFDAENENGNIARYAYKNTEDVELIQDIAVIAMFRNRLKRRIFGRYVKKRLTTYVLKQCFTAIYDTFDYAFFFTSSIFLRGVAATQRKNEEEETEKETPRGESWVES